MMNVSVLSLRCKIKNRAVMKKISFIALVFFLIVANSSFSPSIAQEKTKEEMDRELRMAEELQAQKKAISEQKKEQTEVTRELDEQKPDIEKEIDAARKEVREMRVQADETTRFDNMARMYRSTGNKSFPFEPFVFTPGVDNFIDHPFIGDEERTLWYFSKSIKENSYSGNYTFEVESTAKNVVMSVNGNCDAGDIQIKILMPNGKVYSDIVIDESGDLNWRKSFNITEDGNKDKTGSWKFQINATKATGYFKISLRTY